MSPVARPHTRNGRAPALGAGYLLMLVVGLQGLTFARAAEEDPFAANVRPTAPLTPAEEREALVVPDGFEVQLVAAEPDIHKPMNLAFDAVGRLWVTTSREYPFPVPVGQAGRDRVMIFEDFGPDGRARKVTEFAGGLNIPIGIYPFRTRTNPADDRTETWKAIVWSIPHIWLMEDTDGDGRADRREVLYGPFDHTRDTHGNQASFRRGFDGWLYATHGFNNDSHVAGRDGHRVDLNSGNTYRMRLDGGRLEHFTWGQVNPFGLAWNSQGDLFSSDCHSEPIYLLLPGGYYPSFGKPHDGLGFAPSTMERIRGSTAIDAISYYTDDLWPEEYRDNIFVGDVMTSRVYRDYAEPRGSGRITRQRPDFVVSKDPWFRPVDTTLGPDGALYIADFYNRIIGHYEVPLNHPDRDRERGRLWRVVYRGKPLRSPALARDLPGLIGELGSPSLSRRILAMNDLADRFGQNAVPALRELVIGFRGRSSAAGERAEVLQHVHAMWLLERLTGTVGLPLDYVASRANPLLRLHALRILAERGRKVAAIAEPGPSNARNVLELELGRIAVPALKDADPVVRRCAAHALAATASFGHLRPLLGALSDVDPADTHLVYSLRQALRNQLNDVSVAEQVLAATWTETELVRLADVMVAVRSAAAARFLVRHLEAPGLDTELRRRAILQAARYAPLTDVDRLVGLVRTRHDEDPDRALEVFRSLRQGLTQRGESMTPALRSWGGNLARQLLDSTAKSDGWRNEPLDGVRNTANPWEYEERPCADGTRSRLLSSFPRGESLTGRLRSRPFAIPRQIRFHLSGHDGSPDRPPAGRNGVRLRLVDTSEVVAEARPPRNDTAQPIVWSLASWEGRQAYLEVVDADAGDAYAWLAIGRIEPDAIALPAVAPAGVVARQSAAAEVARAVDAAELKDAFVSLARDAEADPSARAAAALAAWSDPLIRTTADLVADANLPYGWRGRTADVIFNDGRPGAEQLIADVWKEAPRRFQVRFAGLAASTGPLADEMVRRLDAGTAPLGLLQDRGLRDRLAQGAGEDGRRVLDRLVAGLPAEDETLDRLLQKRRMDHGSAKRDPRRGREIYTAACAACHQIEGQGGLVGPQLTGIGTRGLERLCEDILAPNRNVDHAFWTTVLELKDGETTSGLFRREEGEVLVLANAAGNEFTIPKSDVASRRESNQSLMPSNFGEALSEEDFHHLLAYLLGQTGRP